jgi:hypothetical protein
MAQSFARFGRIAIVSSATTDRQVGIPRPGRGGNLGVRCRSGIRCHSSRPNRHARTTPAVGRWAGRAQVGAQRLPDIGGQRYPVLTGRLAAQDAPPGAPVEVVPPQPRRLDRSQAQACDQHEDRVVADTGGIADVAAVKRPLHVVRRDRLRDTGVVTLGRPDISRLRPRAACSDTSRRGGERSSEANGRTPRRYCTNE